MMQIQITLVSDKGYKPVSTVVKVVDLADWRDNQKAYKTRALQNICAQRYWDKRDLTRYGYTSMKCRRYDPVKIAEENKQRYEALKAEKFASGEWKPSAKQLAEMEEKERM